MSTEIKNYNLFFNIDSKRSSYRGKESVVFVTDSGKLTLNSFDLSVSAIRLDGKKATFVESKETRTIEISCPSKMESMLEIEFSGAIPKLLTGLYRARSGNMDIFTTQFESTGARRAFPCVDHPAFKATFDLSLEIEGDVDAISNMPVAEITPSGERKVVRFQTTPPMSTYLLYIGVGKFDMRSIKSDGKEIILAAPQGNLTDSGFPLEIASSSLDLFEDYFGIKYMLPKLHLISVPEFGAGAMENWGAITFREIYLSIDESTSSSNYKRIAEVIAHEIAHHWFGDLVTMQWWNDLWLNESFATFMSYKMVEIMRPGWDPIGDLISLRTEGALKNDALENSHPIDASVKDPEEIAQIFDEISYGKGASILRMIEGYVGKENFRNGIRKYLADHQYSNAKGSDLWSSIEHVSGMPVSRIMEAWIKKRGYPVLTVTREGDRVRIRQERFLLDSEKSSEIWPVPVTIRKTNGTESALLEGMEMTIPVAGFIKLNSDFSGFYRTHYDDALFEDIVSSKGAISSYDLWGLVNDLFAFLQSGRMDFANYISRIRKLWDTDYPLVIQEINNQISSLHLIKPESVEIRKLLEEFSRMQLSHLGEKLDGEEINRSIARSAVMFSLSLVDDQYAESLREKFSSYFAMDPDLRDAIAISYARLTGDFPSLLEKLKQSVTDEDRTKIIGAMGWTGKSGALKESLELIKSGVIKRQDSSRFYTSAAVCPESREFLLANFDFMIRQLKEVHVGSRVPSRTMESTAPLVGLTRESQLKGILRTFVTADLQTGVRKSLELLAINRRVYRALP